MEVHKIYCDRQSCKKEITKNNRCKAVIGIKKPSNYSCDLREREITINVDLCPECAEKLKGILSEFFNDSIAVVLDYTYGNLFVLNFNRRII